MGYWLDYLVIKLMGSFDERFYLRANRDVRRADVSPLQHFLTLGWQEHRNPSAQFDIEYYLEQNPDVRAAGINPYIHYLRFGKKEGRRPLDLTEVSHEQAMSEAGDLPLRPALASRVKTWVLEMAKKLYHKLPLPEAVRFRARQVKSKIRLRGSILTDMVQENELKIYAAAENDPLQPFLPNNPFSFGKNFSTFFGKVLSKQNLADGLGRLDPPWYEKLPDQPNATSLQTPDTPKPARFLLLCLVHQPPAYLLSGMIDSVQRQQYPGWELHLFLSQTSPWQPDILALQVQDNLREQKVFFNRLGSGGILAAIQELLPQVEYDHVIFLNPYDELGPAALAAAVSELSSSRPELVFSRLRKAAYQSEPTGAPAAGSQDFPISQLVVIKKERIRQAFELRLASEENDGLAPFFKQLLADPETLYSSEIASEHYLFRLIPQRRFFAIHAKNGALALDQGVLPLNIVVDARLLGRKVTGTERYIKELLTAVAALRAQANLSIKAITFSLPDEIIDGVEYVPQEHLQNHLAEILNAHLFHKTFPASDWPYLNEMALAPSVVFSPLDLIAYNNPDYYASETEYYLYRKNIETAVNLSDQLIAISHHGKSELAQLLNSGPQNIHPIHLGLRSEEFSLSRGGEDVDLGKLKIPADFFLYVGTDYPHKNLLTLLQALKLLQKKTPGATLVIVGVRYYIRPQPEINALLKTLGERVIQLGHVSEETLLTLYRRAKALVFPSLYEGFGLPILEAMAMGAPVIAANSTSVPEVCGEAALLFDGRDAKQLAGLMARIATDEDLRQELRRKGMENVARFTWQETARKTIAAYQNTVEYAINLSPYQKYQQKSRAIHPFSQAAPTILIVTHVRFYPPTAGNEQRLIKLVKYLKRLGYRIVMLVNSAMEKDPMDNRRRRIMHDYVDYYEELCDTPAERYVRDETAAALPADPLLEKWAHVEMSFCPDEMLARAQKLVGMFSPKVILAEYIWTSRVFELAADGVYKVIDLIDLFSTKQDKVVKYGIKDMLAATKEEEIVFFNRADLVIAIQEKEAEILKQYQPQSEVILAGIDYEFQPAPPAAGEQNYILIIGSDNHINRMCVNDFLENAWPQILQQAPDCQLKIVGKVSSTVEGEHANVQLIPFVQDLQPYYAGAALVMNPVYAGTGLKIKSVEALGHGKALVAWPEGVSGIAVDPVQKPFVEVQSWDDLVLRTVELLSDVQKRWELETLAAEYTRNALAPIQVYRELGDRLDIHTHRPMNILCLFLRYGPNDFPGSLEKLFEWYQNKQQKTPVRLTIWIIDNKLPQEYDGIDLETGFRLLSGDNAQREFSGFQKVLQEQRSQIEGFDLVHFVTSAFNQLFTGYLEYFELEHLYPLLHRDLCLGHIDSYDNPVTLMGAASQSWIRTCFFFMSPRVLYTINPLNPLRDESRFFDANGNFLAEAPLDRGYQQNIEKWLSGKKIQGATWHGKIRSGSEFAEKALTILNEHMLSIRLRKMGVRLVDYYWMMTKHQALEERFDTPVAEEMEQVRVRSKGLFGGD